MSKCRPFSCQTLRPVNRRRGCRERVVEEAGQVTVRNTTVRSGHLSWAVVLPSKTSLCARSAMPFRGPNFPVPFSLFFLSLFQALSAGSRSRVCPGMDLVCITLLLQLGLACCSPSKTVSPRTIYVSSGTRERIDPFLL